MLLHFSKCNRDVTNVLVRFQASVAAVLKTDARSKYELKNNIKTMLHTLSQPCGDVCPLSSRIQDFASAARDLPDHEVACFIHATQKRGVEVGKSQVRDRPGEAFQQGAFGKTHTEDTDHRMVVGSWEKINNRGKYLINISNNADAVFPTDHQNIVNQKFLHAKKRAVHLTRSTCCDSRRNTLDFFGQKVVGTINTSTRELTSNGVGQKGVGHRY